ncbi:MAG: DUF6538 domain-containing protein [Deltaproteobacteria bacterium]
MFYLSKIGVGYYFRMRVPKDVKKYFSSQREFKRTLKTTSYTTAKSLVKKLIAESERVFIMIRSGILNEDMIQEIANNYKESLIHNHDFDRDLGTLSDKRQIKNKKEQEIRMINRMLATDTEFYERTLSEIDENIKCNQMKLGLRRGYKDTIITDDVEKEIKYPAASSGVLVELRTALGVCRAYGIGLNIAIA